MRTVLVIYKLCAAITLLILLSSSVKAQTGTITTIAGGTPNNVFASLVGLGHPGSVYEDSAGANLYITSQDTNNVYQVDLSSGILRTVAGIGVPGYSGDGGPATEAKLNGPIGVAVDGSGNIFIAEIGNCVIREVVKSTGLIQTVAGNGNMGYNGDNILATQAELATPFGVAVDGPGNIFVADSTNAVIREVVKSTGLIQTVAGEAGFSGNSGDGGPATLAQLNFPEGVFVDGSGNIFIADTSNSVIREVVKSTGFIQTVAGKYGNYTFSGDGGAATSASLNFPYGIFVDSKENLFIADSRNHSIRVVAGPSGYSGAGITVSAGDIQTVAGDENSGFSGDGGLATSASLNPSGIFIDSNGNIVIADSGNNRIRIVNTGASSLVLYANTLAQVLVPSAAIDTVAGNGTQTFAGDGTPATSTQFTNPTGISADAFGNIFFNDYFTSSTYEIVASTGDTELVAGTGTYGFGGDGGSSTSAQLSNLYGFALDSSGNIYIADYYNQRIREVFRSSGIIQTVAGTGTPVPTPDGINEAPPGYSGDGGTAFDAQLSWPVGVAVDLAGNIFIADSGVNGPTGTGNRIREVGGPNNATIGRGTIMTVAGGGPGCTEPCPATSQSLSAPFGVSADGAGNIFIADTNNGLVRVANLGATPLILYPNTPNPITVPPKYIQTIAGGGSGCGNSSGPLGDGCPATQASLVDPLAVFVDGAENVYIADYCSIRVVAGPTGYSMAGVTVQPGYIQTVAGISSAYPFFSFSPPVCGFSGDNGPATMAQLSKPFFPGGIWGDQAGDLLIADSGNARIRKVEGITAVPGVSFSPPSLSLTIGESASQTATLTNSGTAPLVISGISVTGPSAADFSLSPTSTCPLNGGNFPLPTNGTCTIVVQLSSGGLNLMSNASDDGIASIAVSDNASGSVITLPNGVEQLQQQLPLAVNFVAPVLSFNPGKVTFNATSSQTIALLSSNETSGLIYGSVLAPSGFTIAPATTEPCTLTGGQIQPGGSCNLNVSWTASAQSPTSGTLTVPYNGTPVTLQLSASALVATNGTSFTVSNTAGTPATLDLELLGTSNVTYTLVCTMSQAGLAISCPTTVAGIGGNMVLSPNTTVSIPSCSGTPVAAGPAGIGWSLYALVAFALSLIFLVRRPQMRHSRSAYALLAIAVLCVAGSLLSCGGISTNGGCIASVATGTYTATVSATPPPGSAAIPVTSNFVITVTQ